MPKDPKALLGLKMRALRTTRGLSQEALADLTRLHRTYIGGIERGERNVSLENIVRISRALGVTPSELLKDVR
jgi:transcriptional regulator with XRE-family HTH domain